MTITGPEAKIPGGGGGSANRTSDPAEPILDLTSDEADVFMRALGEPFLVQLDHLVFPPNPPAGMSPWIVGAIAHDRRNGGHQVRDPILVRRHPTWSEGWLIVDGRHRTAASLMAGCESILAVEAAP